MSQRLHELTVEQVVLAGVAPEVFDGFKKSLLASLHPEGELELTLAENIVVAQWGLRRVQFAESALCKNEAKDPLLNENEYDKLRQLDAATRRHERSLERNLKLLRELQTEREFRRLAKACPVTAPVADSSKARKAFVAEQASKSRVNNANMKAALNEFLNQPAPGGTVTFDRFRE